MAAQLVVFNESTTAFERKRIADLAHAKEQILAKRLEVFQEIIKEEIENPEEESKTWKRIKPSDNVELLAEEEKETRIISIELITSEANSK